MGSCSMKLKSKAKAKSKAKSKAKVKGGSMLGRFAVPAGLLVLQKMMHRRTKNSKPKRKSMRKSVRKSMRKRK